MPGSEKSGRAKRNSNQGAPPDPGCGYDTEPANSEILTTDFTDSIGIKLMLWIDGSGLLSIRIESVKSVVKFSEAARYSRASKGVRLAIWVAVATNASTSGCASLPRQTRFSGTSPVRGRRAR